MFFFGIAFVVHTVDDLFGRPTHSRPRSRWGLAAFGVLQQEFHRLFGFHHANIIAAVMVVVVRIVHHVDVTIAIAIESVATGVTSTVELIQTAKGNQVLM